MVQLQSRGTLAEVFSLDLIVVKGPTSGIESKCEESDRWYTALSQIQPGVFSRNPMSVHVSPALTGGVSLEHFGTTPITIYRSAEGVMPESPIDFHTNIEPRPYQTRIVGKTLDMFQGNYRNGAGETEPAARSVMIESPTGSGKSCMGLLIAKALQLRTGAKVGWVAMRRNLLQQVQVENQRHEINVDLQTISMFAKNPPSDIDLLVVDECVPGDTLVDVLVDGQRKQARMDDVVLHGVGSSVLSYSDRGELEYQPIVSRSPMGRKELLEVTVAVGGEERVLLITEEGKVWTEEGYKKPLDSLGSTILCKSSRCQTYLYGQHTTRRTKQVRRDPTPEGGSSAALCLRLRPEGTVVSAPKDVQEIPLQSPSAESVGYTDAEATADYSWDHAGRRFRLVRAESADGREDQCSITHSAFDEAAVGVCPVAARGPQAAQRRTSHPGESGVWSRGRRVQYSIAQVHPGSGQSGVQAPEVDQPPFSGSLGRTGVCSLVDGRRINDVAGHARVHGSGESADCGLAPGPLGNYCLHPDGQAGAETVSHVSSAECDQHAAFGGALCDPAVVVQVWEIPADALVRGTVVRVRRTGRFVETYDIGVAQNHNFFADGILIHNCQHDAASSMAHIHNVIQPKWSLALTATPFRTDSVKLCFDKVVKDAGIHSLIQDGYLSQFDHYTIPKWDVPLLADFYCAEPQRWGKSIFFFHTQDECRQLHRLLQNRGITSDIVTGSSDRETQLAAFRSGQTQVLINCMVLTEGFDDPSLQTVWIRPSAKGPTMQMAGRALRKFDGLPVKQIVQCQNTPHPFLKTATARGSNSSGNAASGVPCA